MTDFKQSAWADNKVAQNYLDKTDIDVDVVRPPSKELEQWYFAIWKDRLTHMINQYGIKDEVPEDLIGRYRDPASMNKPDTLGNQLKALKTAGVADVDCYFKNGIFVVFGGKRQ